jgi:predicted anti-sigma-YlaC factor YlaD
VNEHEQIQEVLAGYVLRSLTGDDAAAADRLLDEHVPGCVDCRRTLDAFDALTGDLALAAEPVDPPELLLARIHRDMEPGQGGARRFGAGWIAAAAAAVVAVVALGGVLFAGGGTSATLAAADLQQALDFADRPDAQT